MRLRTNFLSGELSLIGSDSVQEALNVTHRSVGDLDGYWLSDFAANQCKNELVYTTQSYVPALSFDSLTTPGVVLWASTILYPGRVGDECFMTRGHFHTQPTHGELIVVSQGEGVLLLMDRNRVSTKIDLEPGVTFYIAGHLAHRTVNTGDTPLVFWCSWPADCGHDYAEIEAQGFSERVLESK